MMDVKTVDAGMLICKCVLQFNNKNNSNFNGKDIIAGWVALYQADRSRSYHPVSVSLRSIGCPDRRFGLFRQLEIFSGTMSISLQTEADTGVYCTSKEYRPFSMVDAQVSRTSSVDPGALRGLLTGSQQQSHLIGAMTIA
jgi:hypothetical protein